MVNRARVFFVCAAFLVSGCLIAGQAAAQSAKHDEAFLKAGVKSLNEGNTGQAIEQLTRAIESGKLSDTDMARALFQRGKAYRLSKKQGQAIADLTSALYLKSLPQKEQDELHLERARAFAGVGMQGQTSADIAAASKAAASSAVEAKVSDTSAPSTVKQAAIEPVTPKPVQLKKPEPEVAAVSASDAPDAVSTAPANTPAPVTTPGPVAPAPPPATQAQDSSFDPVKSVANFFQNLIPGSEEPAPQQQQANETTSAAPPAPVDAPTNLSPVAKPAPVAVAGNNAAPQVPKVQAQPLPAGQERPVWMADPSVTTPQAPPEVPFVIDDDAKSASANGQQGNWDGSTEIQVTNANAAAQGAGKPAPTPVRKPAVSPEIVGEVVPGQAEQGNTTQQFKAFAPRKNATTPPAQKKVQTAANSPAATGTIAKPQIRSGQSFQLMLGAARTQDQATNVWKRLSSKHPSLLSGLSPSIRPVTREGLGSYYVVGLGPFRDWDSTQKICETFKQHGLICSVLDYQ